MRLLIVEQSEKYLPVAFEALAKLASDEKASESARVSAGRAITSVASAVLTGDDEDPGDLMGDLHRNRERAEKLAQTGRLQKGSDA